ncbi:MAG: ATP-binding protein, partial [Oscillospiraceae bacterium]|nr:ATP-binding protein [Oscillospiraceae bacterium]
FQNAAQYSLESSRVFVTLEVDPAHACVRVRNTSKYEIGDAQALLERFTRGDNTRSSEGSGLGLSIAQSFTAACGGTFSISAQADLFTAEVNLPLSKPPQPNQSSEIDPHT